jgi:hypothetical protein
MIISLKPPLTFPATNPQRKIPECYIKIYGKGERSELPDCQIIVYISCEMVKFSLSGIKIFHGI